jgi:hypothetical protein
MQHSPLDTIAKQNTNTATPEEYAYDLLKDGVRDEHAVNSLITLKKLERKKAEQIAHKVSERVAVEKQNRWAIIAGTLFIIGGLLHALIARNGRSLLYIGIGVVSIIGGVMRKYK